MIITLLYLIFLYLIIQLIKGFEEQPYIDLKLLEKNPVILKDVKNIGEDIKENFIVKEVKENDELSFKCSYLPNKNIFGHLPGYHLGKNCFEYILYDISNSIGRMKDFVRGSYNILYDIDSKNYTISKVTLPPIFFVDFNFQCVCYLGYNFAYEYGQKKILHVVIKKSENADKVIGCDFNIEHNDAYSGKHVKTVNTIKYRICNIFYNNNFEYILLICPKNFIINPPNCFEKVYQYENMEDFDLDIPLNDENVKLADINNLFNGKNFQEILGDKYTKFAKVENIDWKGLFMCSCISKKNLPDIYRMNVFFNITKLELPEEIKKSRSEYEAKMLEIERENRDKRELRISEYKKRIETLDFGNKNYLSLILLLLIIFFFKF